MSWPSIWQNQNQAPTNQADMATGNMFMSPEQFALQQQSWQQWQMYQAQLTQWQAQYGDQMNSQAMVPNVFMQNMYPGAVPPLPVENKPPPPPPPSSSTNTIVSDPNAGQSIQTGIPQQQSLLTANNKKPAVETIQSHIPSNVNKAAQPESAKPSTQESFEPRVNRFRDNSRRNTDQDNDDNSYPNWRNNNNRNDRNWIHNNNRNQKRSQNPFANDSNSSYRAANFENENRDESQFQTDRQNLADVKSQEEIEFDEQYRIWEEQFDQWKRDNENHQDGQRYNDFLKQMENCRNKMLQKREMLRKKRLKSFGISDSPPPQHHSQTDSFKRDMDNSKPLFGSNVSGGIPGLDLVHGGNSSKNEQADIKPEIQSAPIADINQILDDPNIKLLLSDIQMQQQQQQQQQHNEMNPFNERRNDRCQTNQMNSFAQSSGSGDSMGQHNPFRNKNNDNFSENSGGNEQLDNNDFNERPMKRECRWNDEHVDDVQQFDRFQQEDRYFPRERIQSLNQSFDAQSFRNNRKRPRNDDQSYFDESARNLNEFRPVQIFDYQNQRQTPSQQQLPAFVQQPAFAGSRLLQFKSDLDFPRRIIEYKHKSKTYNFKEFCPIKQLEYDHKSKPFSLHEHPPIKRQIKNEIKKEAKVETYNNQSYGPRGGEFMQLRQLNWENRPKPWQQQSLPQHQQQQRYPYPNQAPHQQRYDDERFDYRHNSSNDYQRSSDNQSYYNNRNQPERHWQSRDFDDSYNRDRRPQHTASTSSAPYIKTEAKSLTPFIKSEHRKKDIKDLIFPPGRQTRPAKLAILLRGPPGAGKSFVAKTIKEKECEMNGSVRILSIDDYFITENDEQSNGKMVYEYDAAMEDKYMQCLAKLFRKTLIDRLFDLIIVDCNNITLEYLNDFYSSALVHQYTPYVCEMPLDEEKCLKNNIHNRTASDIKKAITSWVPTPTDYTLLKYDSLFNHANATEAISDNEDEPGVSDALDAISDEDVSGQNFDDDDDDDGNSFNEFGCFKSKWDNDLTQNKLARLDGTNKPMKHASIEEYLQMDGWEPPPSSSNGKKRVRWADIEEKREQDKQRAIGFVVGQTNWDNLLDQPRDSGRTALTKIKYIEKVNKR